MNKYAETARSTQLIFTRTRITREIWQNVSLSTRQTTVLMDMFIFMLGAIKIIVTIWIAKNRYVISLAFVQNPKYHRRYFVFWDNLTIRTVLSPHRERSYVWQTGSDNYIYIYIYIYIRMSDSSNSFTLLRILDYLDIICRLRFVFKHSYFMRNIFEMRWHETCLLSVWQS